MDSDHSEICCDAIYAFFIRLLPSICTTAVPSTVIVILSIVRVDTVNTINRSSESMYIHGIPGRMNFWT